MTTIHPQEDAPPKKSSKTSIADSTHSGASHNEFEMPRQSTRSAFMFGLGRKSVGRQSSVGAYTSLFARKLLPPLGFYRESDKYAQLKLKFKSDPFKLDALDEMWNDYKLYQVRKRFRWPPQLVCKKFFWTTGYYADYQKKHRATKLRRPGEDSSDEEALDGAGQYMIAGGEDDINVEEFERYRKAKNKGMMHGDKAKAHPHARFKDGVESSGSDTGSRLFPDSEQHHTHHQQDVEEVETIVEYTLIHNPHKKRKSIASSGGGKHHDGGFPHDLEAGANKKLVTRKKSISTVDAEGRRKMSVEESSEIREGSIKAKSTGKSTKGKK